jgi:hypothetical protein
MPGVRRPEAVHSPMTHAGKMPNNKSGPQEERAGPTASAFSSCVPWGRTPGIDGLEEHNLQNSSFRFDRPCHAYGVAQPWLRAVPRSL